MQSFWILSLCFSLGEAICHHGTSLYRRNSLVDDAFELEDPHTAKPPTFNYTGLGGPLDWHGLSEENLACALGQQQSPISITTETSTPVNGSSLQLNITDFPQGALLLNLGTTLEVEANGTMSLKGKDYKLKQFHFHTPSEHRFEDEFYPMEIHFVFQAADESLAVVGTFVEVAAEQEVPSAMISSVFSNIDEAREFGSDAATAPLDFAALEEHVANSTVWQYDGSLTTPTCAEGVAWNVVQRPLFVSSTTFRQIKSVMKFNSRYTQNVPGGVNLLNNAGLVILKDEISHLFD